MKSLFAAALVFAAATCLAQEQQAVAAERARISAGRDAANTSFAAAERDCYRKFAVNDCLNEAREQRRTVLADLRRQEVALNDMERKRRSAEQLRSIEARSTDAAQAQAAERRNRALAAQKEREDRTAGKTARRPGAAEEAAVQAAPQPPAGQAVRKEAAPRMPDVRKPVDAAGNARRHRERLQEARERKERFDEKKAERNKPGAKPLPVPP